MKKKVLCRERKTGVCGAAECAECFVRSFAASEKSKYWSKRNSLLPSQVSIRGRGIYWFDCDICRHQYTASMGNIFMGHSCPYCSNTKRCGSENCSLCFGHSFASHPMSEFWSKNNEEEPINVSLGSSKLFLFFCPDCCGEYKKSPIGSTREKAVVCAQMQDQETAEKFCTTNLLLRLLVLRSGLPKIPYFPHKYP